MKKRVVIFRVDADEQVGMGHLMRCLTIAEALQILNVESHFVIADKVAKRIVNERGFNVTQIDYRYKNYKIEDAQVLKRIAKKYGATDVVVDSYLITYEYAKYVQEWAKIIAFSCKEEKLPLDILINYNIDCNKKMIEKLYSEDDIDLLLGTEYIPLRKEFNDRKYAIKEKVQSVLVMTGGADCNNFLGEFLIKVKENKWNELVKINCLVGRYNDNLTELKKIANQMINVSIIESTNKVADLIIRNDMIISAGGTSMYEICAIGVPTILYSLADNQISESNYMDNMNIMEYVGVFGSGEFWDRFWKKTDSLMSDFQKRKEQSYKMRKLIDCKGAERIAEAIVKKENR